MTFLETWIKDTTEAILDLEIRIKKLEKRNDNSIQ